MKIKIKSVIKSRRGGMDVAGGFLTKLAIGFLLLLMVGVGYLAISGKLQGAGTFIKNFIRFGRV